MKRFPPKFDAFSASGFSSNSNFATKVSANSFFLINFHFRVAPWCIKSAISMFWRANLPKAHSRCVTTSSRSKELRSCTCGSFHSRIGSSVWFKICIRNYRVTTASSPASGFASCCRLTDSAKPFSSFVTSTTMKVTSRKPSGIDRTITCHMTFDALLATLDQFSTSQRTSSCFTDSSASVTCTSSAGSSSSASSFHWSPSSGYPSSPPTRLPSWSHWSQLCFLLYVLQSHCMSWWWCKNLLRSSKSRRNKKESVTQNNICKIIFRTTKTKLQVAN